MAFSYNASQMECGIKYAKMLDGNGVNAMAKGIKMPSGFSGSSYLNSALNSIGENGINEKIVCLSNNLSSMKAQLENMMSEENRDVMDFMLNNKGQLVKVTGDIKSALGLSGGGTIIIPKDWTPYGEYSLLLNLPSYMIWGGDSVDELPFIKDVVKGNYQSEGVIIYTPNGWGSKGDGHVRYNNLGKIQSNVEKIASKLSINKDAISLTGSSIGGYAAARLVYDNPNFYSAVTICGASFNTHTSGSYRLDVDKVIAENPNTTFIFVIAKGDTALNNYSSEHAEYEKMKAAGLNTILYEVTGAGNAHGDSCWNYLSGALIADMAAIRKGEKYDCPDQPVNVSIQELKATRAGYGDGENSYYVTLSAGNRPDVNPLNNGSHSSNFNSQVGTVTVQREPNDPVFYSQRGWYDENHQWHSGYWDKQYEKETGEKWYSKGGNPIEDAGCQLTATASGLATVLGDPNITPVTVAKIVGSGSNRGTSAIEKAAGEYGLDTTHSVGMSSSKKDQFLENGGVILYTVNEGGHWIAVLGKDDQGNYILCDPDKSNCKIVCDDLAKAGLKPSGSTVYIAPKGYTIDETLNTQLPQQVVVPQPTNNGTNPGIDNNITNTAVASSVGIAASNVGKPSVPVVGGRINPHDNSYVSGNPGGKYISYNGMWYTEEEYAAILAAQNQTTKPSNTSSHHHYYDDTPSYIPTTPSDSNTPSEEPSVPIETVPLPPEEEVTPVTPNKPEEVVPIVPEEEVTPVTPDKPEEVVPIVPEEEVTPVTPDKPEEVVPIVPEEEVTPTPEEEKVTPVTPRPRPSRPSVVPDASEEVPEEIDNPQTIDELYQKALKDLESYEPKTDFDVDDTYTDVPYNSPSFEFEDNTSTNVEPELPPIEPEPVIPVVIPEVEPVESEEPGVDVGKVIGGIAATAGVVGAGIAAKKMYDKEKEKEYNNEYVEDDYNYDTEEDMSDYNNGDRYEGINSDDYVVPEEKEEEVQYDENGYPIQKESIVPDEDDY